MRHWPVSYTHLKNDATEEEMWKALDIAQATEVVKGKEGGLDYMIEQGGKNLYY